MYLVLRCTATKIEGLGHRNVNRFGKKETGGKDYTVKEHVYNLIHVNLYTDIIDVMATYGLDAEIPDEGRNWSSDVFRVWKFLSTVEQRGNDEIIAEVKPYLEALANKLPKGIQQLFTMEIVRKSNHKLMAVPFMVMMHYVLVCDQQRDAVRGVYYGGYTWRNGTSKVGQGENESDCIVMSDAVNAAAKTPAQQHWLGKIGELALKEGTGYDGKIHTIAMLCAHSLKKDDEATDKYIGHALDWIKDGWGKFQNEATLLLHWKKFEKKKPKKKSDDKKTIDKIDVPLLFVKGPLTKLIDETLKKPCDVQIKTALLEHINSLGIGKKRYTTYMEIRRNIAGVYRLPDGFTGEGLYQVLDAITMEAGDDLSNTTTASSDLIEQALQHEGFQHQVRDGYEEEITAKNIIFLIMKGDEYRTMMRKWEAQEELNEGWKMDFMSIIRSISNAKNWITTCGNKDCDNMREVPIIFATNEAIQKICGEKYVEPDDDEGDDNESSMFDSIEDAGDY